MKDRVQVSLVQFASEPLNRDRNVKRMVDFVGNEANHHGADLVVFPELSTTGYVIPHVNSDFAVNFYKQAEPVPGPTTEALALAAKESGAHVVVGLARRHSELRELLYNSAVLISPEGGVLGMHDKVHPCLDEKNYFAPGNAAEIFETELGSIGLNVCYDVRFPELARVQALKGAEMIVSLWASFIQPGKVPSDSIVNRCATRAMENALYFLGCNRSGVEGGRVFYGRSAIASPSGEILAKSDDENEEVVRAALTHSDLAEQRAYLTVFRDRRPDLYAPITDPL